MASFVEQLKEFTFLEPSLVEKLITLDKENKLSKEQKEDILKECLRTKISLAQNTSKELDALQSFQKRLNHSLEKENKIFQKELESSEKSAESHTAESLLSDL